MITSVAERDGARVGDKNSYHKPLMTGTVLRRISRSPRGDKISLNAAVSYTVTSAARGTSGFSWRLAGAL
jgi:hypothetical protein